MTAQWSEKQQQRHLQEKKVEIRKHIVALRNRYIRAGWEFEELEPVNGWLTFRIKMPGAAAIIVRGGIPELERKAIGL